MTDHDENRIQESIEEPSQEPIEEPSQEPIEDRIAFWNEPERVERFAGRDPDHRLAALLGQYEDPSGTRVLDLGCAGGRNSVLLAERGFDLWALDAASAMVARTRERLAALIGPDKARRRVREGRMEELGSFEDGSFDLVVAIGIYHCAEGEVPWRKALAESVRVLAPRGSLLVSQFAPGTTVSGNPHVKEADQLDEALRAEGLVPVSAPETVIREAEGGRRVTVSGLYRKSRSEIGSTDGRNEGSAARNAEAT